MKTMPNVQEEIYIEGLGTIYYCNDSAFDEASEAMLSRSDGLITLEDLAYARTREEEKSPMSQYGSYVREGSLFVPRAVNKRIWLRKSLVLQNPSAAVNTHRKGGEYLLPADFNVDEYLEKIGKNNYFILTDNSPAPTNRFGEDERMRWAFEDKKAETYGQFLADLGIEAINMWMLTKEYIDNQERPFANQLWLHRLGNYSTIGGFDGDLSYNGRVRGVRYGNVDVAPKDLDLYTAK